MGLECFTWIKIFLKHSSSWANWLRVELLRKNDKFFCMWWCMCTWEESRLHWYIDQCQIEYAEWRQIKCCSYSVGDVGLLMERSSVQIPQKFGSRFLFHLLPVQLKWVHWLYTFRGKMRCPHVYAEAKQMKSLTLHAESLCSTSH